MSVFVSSSCCNKYHRQGGLNNRRLFSYSPRGRKLKIKMLAPFVSLEASGFDLQMAAFAVVPHMTSPHVHPSPLSLFY